MIWKFAGNATALRNSLGSTHYQFFEPQTLIVLLYQIHQDPTVWISVDKIVIAQTTDRPSHFQEC